jgi:enoyl-CoA hydratase
MAYETLHVETQDGVVVVTINRPQVRNALSAEVVRDLRAVLDAYAEDETVHALIFTGAGDKAFAAGADIRQLRDRTFKDGLAGGMQKLYDEIEDYVKPTIAAVNGYALGGGCELALACDIRIASTNAKFGLPELNLGIIPGAGGTQRLARLVGVGRALEMILTGRMIEAAEAERIGLVSRVVEPEQLVAAAKEVAAAVAAKGPVAVRLARLAVKAGIETDLRTGLLVERLAQAIAFETEDKLEGTSAFLEKRKPQFKNR